MEDYSGLRNNIRDLAREHGLRTLLLLDEFETLAKNTAFDTEFFIQLRSLANAPEYRFGILIASRRSLFELRRIHTIEASAFWNLFGFKHTLGLLSEDEAGELHEPMRRSLKPKQRPDPDWLWEQLVTPITGCHPALLQMTAHAVWQARADCDQPDLARVRYGARDYLLDQWNHLDGEQRTVLPQVVEGKEPSAGPVYEDLKQRGLLTDGGEVFSTQLGEVVRERYREDHKLGNRLKGLGPASGDSGGKGEHQLWTRLRKLAGVIEDFIVRILRRTLGKGQESD